MYSVARCLSVRLSNPGNPHHLLTAYILTASTITGPDRIYRASRYLFLVPFSLIFLFVPCGGLSWLHVRFLVHFKYTVSYRIHKNSTCCFSTVSINYSRVDSSPPVHYFSIGHQLVRHRLRAWFLKGIRQCAAHTVLSKGVFIATQLNSIELNSTQLTQLNSVQPSQSCVCLWRHDLQTESTVVHAVELSSVEFSWVELCRYKHPLRRLYSTYNIYNWIESFSCGHSHCTKFGNNISHFSDMISASVIQGSGVGPVSYVVTASDLHPVNSGNLVTKYADDTYLIISASNVNSCTSEIEHIELWSTTNNLQLNRAKSSEISKEILTV